MKQTFLIILVLCLSISSALAQTNSCGLKLNVYNYQENPAILPEPIKGVTASLQNIKSHSKIKNTLHNEMPYFVNVEKGTYQATISMKGYKVTTKEIELTCEFANEQNFVSENMFLWKGSSNETVKMFGTSFTIGSKDGESQAASLNVSKVDKPELVHGKSAYIPQPIYPAAARAVRASGSVRVGITIDELGNIESAKALDGHPLLRAAAEKAARESKFESTRLQGIPVKITGILVYNFIPN